MDARVQERQKGAPPRDQIDWDDVDRIATAMAKVVYGESSANGYTATLIIANAILLGVATEYASQKSLTPDDGAKYLAEAHQAAPGLLADLVPHASEIAQRMMAMTGRH